MSHIDTLKTFDDLVASGINPDHARANIKSLETYTTDLVTKSDLTTAITGLKIYILQTIGAAIFIPIILQIFLQIVLKKLGI